MTDFFSQMSGDSYNPRSSRRKQVPIGTVLQLLALVFGSGVFVQTVRYLEARMDKAEQHAERQDETLRNVDTSLQILNARLRDGKVLNQ